MRKKRSVGIKHIVFFIAFLMIGIVGISGSTSVKNMAYAKEEKTDVKKKEDRFVIESKGRIGNYTRMNEEQEIVTTVTNHGADFQGYVQVIMINEDYGDNVMYQTDLVLAEGETKTVSQIIRMTANTSNIMVRITDAKEKELQKKKIKLTFIYEEQVLTGILTDNKQNMGYWDNEKVVYLKKEDISSAKGMGVMDVLIINNFNTADLEKEQYAALKEWVELGGTLVIGTGEQVNRTLAMFQDDYLSGKIGNVKQGIADISFQKESVVDDYAENLVLHNVEKGIGVICVANKDLGMDKSLWKNKGYEYVSAIKDQYSLNLQERIDDYNNNRNHYYYGYGSSSIIKGNDEIPDMNLFTIMICVYILAVTIGVYLILKKKDKLEWTWGIVPVVVIVFSGIIIVMGMKTRVSGTYMSYKKVMNFQEEGSSGVKNVLSMNVASSNNSEYEIQVPEGVDVYASSSGDFYSDSSYGNNSYEEYNIGFKNKGSQKVVSFKNNQAFEGSGLVSESVETIKGSYESNIHFLDSKISGTFTNNTEYTIKNAILSAEGNLYKLGTIEPGKTVKINDKTVSASYSVYRSLGKNFYDIIGVPEKRQDWTVEEARYMDGLESILDRDLNYLSGSNAVYGYLEDDEENSMKKEWNMECFGITLMKFPINVDYRTEEGDIYVPDVIKDGKITKGDYCIDYEERVMYGDEEFLVEYNLDKGERLSGIYFSKSVNASVRNSMVSAYGEPYEGNIEVFNWKTNKYEVLFDTSKDGNVTEVENYVGKENIVRFRMIPQNKDPNADIDVPVISLTKEVKTNG